jgi:hypothetical protein
MQLPEAGFVGYYPNIKTKVIICKRKEILKKLKKLRLIIFSFFFVLILKKHVIILLRFSDINHI